jgi:hypothetical protein
MLPHRDGGGISGEVVGERGKWERDELTEYGLVRHETGRACDCDVWRKKTTQKKKKKKRCARPNGNSIRPRGLAM